MIYNRKEMLIIYFLTTYSIMTTLYIIYLKTFSCTGISKILFYLASFLNNIFKTCILSFFKKNNETTQPFIETPPLNDNHPT